MTIKPGPTHLPKTHMRECMSVRLNE